MPRVIGGGAPSGAKGGLGQHFLRNPAVINAIIQKANIRPHDVVLEVGPGSGVMTFKMLPLCKKLIAVELDNRMIVELQKKVQLGNNQYLDKFELVQGDVLKTPLPFFNILVANIPYKISSPLVFKLLAHRPIFRCAVLMFQEEFAQRLTAKPGDNLYCRLSVNVQLLAEVHNLLKVGRQNFRPPPKVDSRVVRISPRVPLPKVDFREWDGLTRLCFNRKNKTLKSVLSSKGVLKVLQKNMGAMSDASAERILPDLSAVKEVVERTLRECEMTEHRAAKMDTNDFLALLNQFNKNHVRFS